ncbi:hypothetical protein ScPMuIL_011743 [Solemya velum]
MVKTNIPRKLAMSRFWIIATIVYSLVIVCCEASTNCRAYCRASGGRGNICDCSRLGRDFEPVKRQLLPVVDHTQKSTTTSQPTTPTNICDILCKLHMGGEACYCRKSSLPGRSRCSYEVMLRVWILAVIVCSLVISSCKATSIGCMIYCHGTRESGQTNSGCDCSKILSYPNPAQNSRKWKKPLTATLDSNSTVSTWPSTLTPTTTTTTARTTQPTPTVTHPQFVQTTSICDRLCAIGQGGRACWCENMPLPGR